MIAASAPAQTGSAQHRGVLGRFFLESHVKYVPEEVIWPELSEPMRERLAAMPFWQEAISTENSTSSIVSRAASLESDPLIREALELQGFEEQRHARLLRELTKHYRIKVQFPPPHQVTNLEHEFLLVGFGECFDSFFAFGLFAIAQQSGLFPAELTRYFEPVIQEEARHILFFVNWVRYRRSQLGLLGALRHRLRCARIILQHLRSRLDTARAMSAGGNDKDNFTMSAHQELGADITLHQLLAACLAENERRLAPYDSSLRRPRLVPGIAKFLYRVLPSSI